MIVDQDAATMTAALERVRQLSAQTGIGVFAHAIDIDSGRGLGVQSDSAVVTASVFKVPILLEYARQSDAGELDAARSLIVDPATVTLGPTGLSVFSDPTTWSIRDIATSMITVSDNAATDILLELVGRDRVNETMSAFGLPGTFLEGDCQALFESMGEDLGVDLEGITAAMDAQPELVPTLRANTPEVTNRTTPRESTRLLQLLWTDAAGTPAACAEARRILGLQVWPHRLTSGFPGEVALSGKTGTIGVVRNEIGVVEYPDGARYAVAVFLRIPRYRSRAPEADALIGAVGRTLVDALRSDG
ncbi:serine hydrolase [Microbacterium sp. Root61]|uniref:serine hydrolase n=1 Tax=Microbacterium sp. Root61 TaxID=1736570 RepID=UPI000AD6E0E0|nr:serine hydrolase [Microbacterium sp. Root61]